MPRSLKRLITLLAVGSLYLLTACSFSLAGDLVPPPGAGIPVVAEQPTEMSGVYYPLVPPNLEAGAVIYAENCASCHGEAGMGNGSTAVEISVPAVAIGNPSIARQGTPSDWYLITTQGNAEKSMPSFANLSDVQRWDVVAYVYSLSMASENLGLGEQVYQASCAPCHGNGGKGDGIDAAGLPSQPRDFTDQAWMAERSNAGLVEAMVQGRAPAMPAFAEQIPEESLWAAAAFLRTFTMNPSSFGDDPVEAVSGTRAAGTEAGSEITSTLPLSTSLTGGVTVQLINGSGGETPAGLPVMLYGFDEMQLVYTSTLESQSSGAAIFEDVPKPIGRAFLAGVEYLGTTTGSNVKMVEDPTLPLTLTVSIFDTTTDTSALSADRMHVFFDFSTPEQVQVVEVFVISNLSNRAVVAVEEGGPVVTFPLPEGAENLQFQDGLLGERYLEIPGGFADTQVVTPGLSEYQVIFGYSLPYERSLGLSVPVSLPVDSVIVMLPDVGVKVKSDQLVPGEAKDVQGTQYLMYSGEAIRADSPLTLELSGKPGGSSPALLTGADDRSSLLIGLGAFGVALIVLGLWFFVKNKPNETDEEPFELGAEADEIPSDPEALMDAIIVLDDLHKAGELPEQAYLQRRAELKEKLNGLLGKEA